MTLEIILWIVAGIVVSETIFVGWYFKDSNDWVRKKVLSFIWGGFFIFFHMGIVFCPWNGPCIWNGANYIKLLYEGMVLLGIGILFGVNYLIKKQIDKR